MHTIKLKKNLNLETKEDLYVILTNANSFEKLNFL